MKPRVLLLPGWQNSGPAHWQSRWEARHGYLRVEQHDWMQPLRGDWIARLQDVVLAQPASQDAAADIVLVAHSLGCQLAAAWDAISASRRRVRAAFLVAPGDPQCAALADLLPSWSPAVLQKLPFPSLLLASQNDPYCSFSRAREFAAAWGAHFIDCGHKGHINSDTGLGDWPEGHAELMRLCQQDPTKEIDTW